MGKSLVAALLLCAAVSTYTFAQTSNATLGGTVSDATGALIPGVSITATNTQTGIVSTTVSNEAGAYQFPSLQTGNYRARAELPGFQTQTYNEVVLGVSQQVRLNFTLQVGSVATALEVTVAADTLLATSSSSVGTVLPEYKVRDLPLASRDVLDLIRTQGGTQSTGGLEGVFAGNRLGATNTTRDGIVVGDGRYENGAFSATYASPDLVEEVRVIVSTVDAEAGRGSGQVQMVTRSGTNQFRGSVFWTNRNSALDANTWFNNFNGVGKNYDNRNQYGGRLGGPIIHNKTFFFFLFEGQRYIARESFVGPALTAQARQGIFRFFPGVDNGNAVSNRPTVDFQGNPVKPAGATGDLQSFNVFGRDPARPTFDNSAFSREILKRMPPANDFTSCGPAVAGTFCDGLNLAGVRWVRHLEGLDFTLGNGPDVDRDQYNMRIDHSFNANHKLSLVGSREKTWGAADQAGRARWPDAFSGLAVRRPDVYSISFVSTLSPTLVNEFRGGRRRSINFQWPAPDRPDETGREAFSFLPRSNGIPVKPSPINYPESFIGPAGLGGHRIAVNPITIVGDNLSWTRGKHAFKFGGELRYTRSDSANQPDLFPRAFYGAGGVPVAGIDSNSISGLTGNNQTAARNLLIDLAGSLDNIRQGFGLKNSKDLTWVGYPDLILNRKRIVQDEFSWFIKDDWKLRPNVTLNVGVHYEGFAQPYEDNGLSARVVGGKAGLFGISGTDFNALWHPGVMQGSITRVEFVGKKSTHPDKKTNRDDWNNFAPAVGLSWSLPWWGRDKTVVRAGYGMSYLGGPRSFNTVETIISNVPGIFHGSGAQGVVYSWPYYVSMSSFTMPQPIIMQPLEPVPLTDRTQSIAMLDRVASYIQNWNLEVQREIARNLTMEVRYIGSKGTKLWGGIQLNAPNIFENGILDAFKTTRAGDDALLFDQMLRGINLGGGVVNGTTLKGSAALRQNATTRNMIANGNVGALANFLNTSTTGTGEGGGLLRRNGFPENFIVVNPQFSDVTLHGNPGNSTYHSLQLQVTKRLSNGLTNQTTYTWSRNLGEADGDGGATYRNPRNRSLDKSLLGFHRTHDLTSNGTYELPFGPNRPFLKNASGLVQRLVERWQLGGIFSWGSGPPLTITAPITTFTYSTTTNNLTPNIVGDFPKSAGKITKVANGVVYFDGLQQIPDPSRSNVTALQATQGAFSNKAITDSQGRILLVNPEPGTLGNLGMRWIEGPSNLGLDVDLIKRVRIKETKEFEFRVDAINVLNHPNFTEFGGTNNPNLSINSTSFGRITAATGNRRWVFNARVNF